MSCVSQIDFKNFPTTRYQGSKRKILPWIHQAAKNLQFESALDAFGGSGSVSYLFKRMGKSVTYNDKLTFNYLIGKAIIENQNYRLTPIEISRLMTKSEAMKENFIASTFRDIYFLEEENIWLDNVVSNIENMSRSKQESSEYKQALAYYAIFQASLIKRPFNLFHRKNLHIRTNEVPRNFGNKTTWEKSFDEHFRNFANEANSLIFDNGKPCKSLNSSAFDLDGYGYDLVYLDPPYLRQEGSNESSNYLKCYHFLEGLSQYRRWPELVDHETINLRLKGLEKSNDFKKEDVYLRIEELLSNFRNSTMIFSYKKGGIPSIDYIKKSMKKFKRNVYTVSMHYKYALNHQNGDAKNNREVLIIGV